MSRKAYLILKLLNQANILAETQSLWSWIISLAMQNTYLKLFSGLNFLFVIQFPKFLLHILRQTFKILDIVKKIFYLIINKQ